MNTTFNDLVDIVRELPIDEKIEIKDIIEKSIIDENRNNIFQNYIDSKKEYQNGKLSFSSNIENLKKSVNK